MDFGTKLSVSAGFILERCFWGFPQFRKKCTQDLCWHSKWCCAENCAQGKILYFQKNVVFDAITDNKIDMTTTVLYTLLQSLI